MSDDDKVTLELDRADYILVLQALRVASVRWVIAADKFDATGRDTGHGTEAHRIAAKNCRDKASRAGKLRTRLFNSRL